MTSKMAGSKRHPSPSFFAVNKKRRQSTDMGILHGDPLSPTENLDFSDVETKRGNQPGSKHKKDLRSTHRYNFIFRLLFIWLEPLFFLGAHRELDQEDLTVNPRETHSEDLLKVFNSHWSAELDRQKHGQSARLWVALLLSILWRFILQGLLILLEAGILLYQSVILGQLSEYFSLEQEDGKNKMRDAFLLAFGLIVMSLVVVIMHSHSFLMGQKMSMMLRVTSTAAIYQKILTLSQATIGRLSVGHIVNLASNDVQRFDPVFPHLPYLWVSPLHLVVFTYLVYQEVGWSAFVATGFILLQVPLQIMFARLFIKFRIESAELTDRRIHVMNEVISGIRVIKMYAWEEAFKKVVAKIRKKESIIIFKGAIIRACNLAYMIVSTSIAMWLVLTVHTLTGSTLTTRQAFTVLSLLTSLRLSSYFFVLGLLGYSEGRVAVHRIQNFLLVDEYESALSKNGVSERTAKSTKEVLLRTGFSADVFSIINPLFERISSRPTIIQVDNLSASWMGDEDKLVLKDINLEVNKNVPLLAVIGPVGAGKSSLLQCLMGELPALKGSVTVQGSVSYVSQEPWVFGGTIQENILFGRPYDPVLYRRVLHASLLHEDLEEFLLKDMTVVGERGATLSGGQKARVNLARAMYRDGDVLLLDDPLSALDVNVAAHIYDRCINELLENKLVVLVTHQIQYALKANKILLIKDGRQEVYNSPSELLSKGMDPAYLIGLIHEEDDDGERNMYSYKKFDDPPSPTIISMLSVDPFEESDSMAATSTQQVSDTTAKDHTITPLALFSKSVRENLPLGKPYTGTCDIVVKRKPRFFIFPVNENKEREDNAADGGAERARGGGLPGNQCQVGWEKVGIEKSNQHSVQVHISSPSEASSSVSSDCGTELVSDAAWPFAGLPPGSAKENESETSKLRPFSGRRPAHTGTSNRLSPLQRRKNSVCGAPFTVQVVPSAELETESNLARANTEDRQRFAPSPLTIVNKYSSAISEHSFSMCSEQEENISRCSYDSKTSSLPQMDLLVPTPLMTPRLPSRYAHSRTSSNRRCHSSLSMRSVHSIASYKDEGYRLNIQPSPFDTASIFSMRSKISVQAGNLAATEHEDLQENTPGKQSEEFRQRGSVSLSTYYKYFISGGNILLIAVVIVLFLLGEAGIVVSDWWLSDWASCFGAGNSTVTSGYCYLSDLERSFVYTATTAAAVVLNFTRVISFCFICIHAAMVLHNQMFKSILGTKVLFFDKNPIGRILNRFSKDIGFLDDLLPYNFCEFLLLSLRCSAIVFTAASSNAWLIIPALAMTALFIALRWYYLRSAHSVKRIESIARSPMYSHLSSTLQGLCTIRSCQQERVALQKLHALQNEHSQVWYLYLVMVRWFGIRVDFLSVFFLASVAFISIPLATDLNPGLVGLSLTYTISLADMLQYTIRLSAEVENTMTSVERVMEYGVLEPEESCSDVNYKEPPKDWPSKGEIKMENVCFKYESDQPNVLSDLCITASGSEKVGIVGRTGAGKSSLISVLYRLAEPEGHVVIDGISTKSIKLNDLRQKMSIIPQDPLLFSGTVRYNLDPLEEYSDLEVWEALEQVQLKSAVQVMEGQLSGEVSESGSNFSVGQRQLMCLARALLRKNKIIILDEATANVDPRTDGIIQKAIHDSFSDCTVLVIAHRLNTIMDSDKLIFLKNGKIMEYASPYKLLQDPNSNFYLMVEKTGDIASGRLHQIALESHLQKMFKKSGRLTPGQAKFGVKNMSHLFAKSLLQRTSGSGPFGLSRLQERRASILSSNSFPRALNKIGLSEDKAENPDSSSSNSPHFPAELM